MCKQINKKLALVDQFSAMAKELVDEMQKESVTVNVTTPPPDTWLNHKDYAKVLGIQPDALYIRCRDHFYDTPEGYTEKCFYNSAKSGSPIFNVRLANMYYEINNHLNTKKNEHSNL